MKGRPPMSIPRAATSVQIRNRACANRATNQKPRLCKQRERPIRKRAGEKATNQKAFHWNLSCMRCDQWESASVRVPTNQKQICKSVRSESKACLNRQGSIRKPLRQQSYQYLIITRWACSKKAANKKAWLQTLGPIRKHQGQESKNLIRPSCGFPKKHRIKIKAAIAFNASNENAHQCKQRPFPKNAKIFIKNVHTVLGSRPVAVRYRYRSNAKTRYFNDTDCSGQWNFRDESHEGQRSPGNRKMVRTK
jgi:hypothetical protein